MTAINGTDSHTHVEELDAEWREEFLVPWKMPPGYRFPIRVGREGEFVDWLASVLNHELPAEGPAVYTRSLEEKVMDIQKSAGLHPDGVVGPLTINAINNWLEIDAPQLAR